MNHAQEQGRALYKRGDYRKAIECFDRGIGHAPSVQLLDNRAACYEKLGEFPPALKDAKKAIQLHREDATGYLRAGRVLNKMEKQSVALEVLSHGLRCIKHVGQGYEALKKAHKDVLDIVSPPQSVDPLTMLPRELAETIMQYLSFRQRINACLVSRGWKQFIRSSPNLWTHLDLTGARKNVRSAFISTAINTGRSKLREATLNRLYDFDKTVKALVRSCPLEKLTLLECGRQGLEFNDALAKAKHLKSIDIRKGTSVVDLQHLVEALSGQLESIHLSAVQTFSMCRCERLSVFSAYIESHRDAIRLLANAHIVMPNIRYLCVKSSLVMSEGPPSCIFDFAACSKLETLDCGVMTTSNDTMLLPATVKVLRFGYLKQSVRGGRGIIDNTRTSSAALRLPHLEELEIQCGNEDDGREIQELLCGFEGGHLLLADQSKTWTKLHSLTFSNANFEMSTIDVCLKEPRLQNLRVLKLLKAVALNDEKVAEVMKHFPKLELLDVSFSDVTGVGVRAIASGTRIEEINLRGCRFVGLDAVGWARARGLRVHFSGSDVLGGAKKVRY